MPPKVTLYAWLLVPIALLAYYLGPGEAKAQRSEIARLLGLAAQAEQREDWKAAREAYARALEKTPVGDSARRGQMRLANAKARMYSGEIVEAVGDLRRLLAETPGRANDARFISDVRATLGAAEYYTAWLMRLEGAPEDDWGRQAALARDEFGLLTGDRLGNGVPLADHQKCLEAAIRLARMDLGELRSMPLPKFCASCTNVSQKCRTLCVQQGEAKAAAAAETPGRSSLPVAR
jgi:tetratricopeptide (TPR) repeat protein